MTTCPSCDAAIPDGAIRPARKMAVCPGCDATVRLEKDGSGWRAVGFTSPAPPDGLIVEVDEPPVKTTGGYRDAIVEPGRFTATRRWWTPAVLFLTLFVIVWDGFLVFWYAMAFSGIGRAGGMGILFVLFPLIHVAAGVGLTWSVIATWLNRTTIDVRDGRLTCSHAPIPWPFGKTEPIALDAVELFETEEAVPRFNAKRRNGSPTWKVVARTKDGRRIPVVNRLRDERQAMFVARRLDAQLG